MKLITITPQGRTKSNIEPTSGRKKKMVGTWGLEPQTFPASRDALTNGFTSNQLLNGMMRFTALDLPFALPRRRKCLEVFLID